MVLKIKYLLTNWEATKPPFRPGFILPAPFYAWGFATTLKDVEREREIVRGELENLKNRCEFEVEFAGGYIVTTGREVFQVADELGDADVILVFGTTDSAHLLEAVLAFNRPTLIFIKVYKGNLYEQAEVVNARFLRGETDQVVVKDPNVFVVFDDYEKLLKILRALNAVKRVKETTCLCLGAPAGWQGRFREVRAAQRKLGLRVTYGTYQEFERLLREASENPQVREKAGKVVEHMLEKAKKVVGVSREEVVKAAVAYLALKELIQKKNANALTIECFPTFIQTAGITPCMCLSLFNDMKTPAGCEADFSTFAAQLLLTYVSDKPAGFLNPQVHPDANKVILAHCTSPLRMNGYQKAERPLILSTEFCTRKAVAVQALHPEGQEVTLVDPSFAVDKMVISKGRIIRNTDYPICRSQLEVEVKDSQKLWENLVGFHWVMVYGDYVEEMRIACGLLGIEPIVV